MGGGGATCTTTDSVQLPVSSVLLNGPLSVHADGDALRFAWAPESSTVFGASAGQGREGAGLCAGTGCHVRLSAWRRRWQHFLVVEAAAGVERDMVRRCCSAAGGGGRMCGSPHVGQCCRRRQRELGRQEEIARHERQEKCGFEELVEELARDVAAAAVEAAVVFPALDARSLLRCTCAAGMHLPSRHSLHSCPFGQCDEFGV